MHDLMSKLRHPFGNERDYEMVLSSLALTSSRDDGTVAMCLPSADKSCPLVGRVAWTTGDNYESAGV